MNYELAKELDEAQFPYDPERHSLINRMAPCDSGEDCTSRYCTPSLSELVGVCGNQLTMLLRIQDDILAQHPGVLQWEAQSKLVEAGLGSTPEEAVARLWLALNKK
jgi:hypothetical protein